MQKKKLSVIRPTLRHKKRYILIKLLDTAINFDSKKIYSVLTQALLKNSGLFVQVDTNITILEADVVSKTLLIRINKDYLNEFISSLFFAQAELGLLKIVETTSTIKKIKGDVDD
jgi:RNase P/RNase MRP subunit POP5